MSKPQYGRSWWGAQWLQSLAEIDHDNRLPRGRTYANRGAVRDLVVQENRIRAHVQGSRARPYDIDIEVPPITAADATRLTQRLAADPGLIARLLNHDLDPAVLKETAALGIQVFPSRWSDLKMHCSCPDWAVPCKHLAAVIYLLSQEIDGDPFLVFRLRCVELDALLGQHGMVIDAEADRALPKSVLAFFDEGSQQQLVAPPDPVDAAALEERINDMIRSKRELAEMTVGTGETWVGQLPPEELNALFQLG